MLCLGHRTCVATAALDLSPSWLMSLSPLLTCWPQACLSSSFVDGPAQTKCENGHCSGSQIVWQTCKLTTIHYVCLVCSTIGVNFPSFYRFWNMYIKNQPTNQPKYCRENLSPALSKRTGLRMNHAKYVKKSKWSIFVIQDITVISLT